MSHRDPFSAIAESKVTIASKMYKRFKEDDHFKSQVRAAQNGASAKKSGRGGYGPARAPAFLVCYLCGQQFGTASLGIHQPQCYVKKLLQWEKGDLLTRGTMPIHPDEKKAMMAEQAKKQESFVGLAGGDRRSQIQKFNEEQFQEYNDKALVPCENCGRTFLPDRLPVHLKSCKPGAKRFERKKPPAVSAPTPMNKKPLNASVANSALSPSGPGSSVLSPGSTANRSSSPPIRPMRNTPDMLDSESPNDRSPKYFDPCDNDNNSNDTGGLLDMCETTRTFPDGLNDDALLSPPSKSPRHPCPAPEGDEELALSLAAEEEEDFITKRSPKIISRPMDLSHVTSRFSKGAVGGTASDLPRCQYCNRTFASDRLEKHEDVCMEKKKKLAVRPVGTRSGAVKGPPAVSSVGRASPGTPVTVRIGSGKLRDLPNAGSPAIDIDEGRRPGQSPRLQGAKTISPRETSDEPISSRRVSSTSNSGNNFCTECGSRVPNPKQKFCGDCGFRFEDI